MIEAFAILIYLRGVSTELNQYCVRDANVQKT